MLVAVLLLAVGAVPARAQTPAPAPAPAEAPKPKWVSSAAAGMTMTSGNSETTMATLTANTDRKWDQNEFGLGVDGAYGQSKVSGQKDTATTAELLHGFIQYNRLVGDRFYGYGRIEGRHDGVADLKYRVSIGPGAGYYFIKEKTTDLSAEVGPGYTYQKLGDETSSYATLRVGEKFHRALSDRARVWQIVEWRPQVDKFNNYLVNAEIGIEADLTKDKRLALRSYVTDSFNNQPAPGRKKNDTTWVTSIAYKF